NFFLLYHSHTCGRRERIFCRRSVGAVCYLFRLLKICASSEPQRFYCPSLRHYVSFRLCAPVPRNHRRVRRADLRRGEGPPPLHHSENVRQREPQCAPLTSSARNKRVELTYFGSVLVYAPDFVLVCRFRIPSPEKVTIVV